MPTEIEARFSAGTPGPLDALAARPTLGRARLGDPRTVDEVDRYLDTDDGRLAAARWACRLRSREGSTRISLKGPPSSPPGGWVHRRPEIEGPASELVEPDQWPPSPALDKLMALRAGRPLTERLRLHQARTERTVEIDGDAAIGTLTLDRVRMCAGDADLGELFVVELELSDASEAGERKLLGLAAALAAIDGLRAEPRSKLEHALARLDARG
jgi:inorganic triphosphatase YgiF